ncbi:Ima1 N-terminal domain-containing protein [Pyronema domesticum]|uniref:Similar to Uncharacterized protein C737.03c acc. no. O13681 n=1 Tax=Pyronema omphalodes (strain CBS 100304) TaxID=1076935 RepID=U4L9H4_PYROM|nr:Ima1 N-terminal domain-containing protein [Pyronema domesticum]CCX06834.1 Similar to Uncharacterized protein C737.03c; acc. no. O13681 [Pyronema omphalodes CBS 100304]
MSSLFRRRKVSCFYCGQHSLPNGTAVYHSNGRVSTFVCPHCNADNHYDQNGEIVDYVPETPPKPMTFAYRRTTPRGAAATINNAYSQSKSIFCTNCEHNQILLQSARNNYDMPPEDHPDYDKHVNVLYPRYIKEFEARYPQMCENCSPKAKQLLKANNYNAKVRSLGMMLARTEQPGGASRSRGLLKFLKFGVWVARGAVWWWANAIFLLWHLSAFIHATTEETGIGMEQPTWNDCFIGSYEKQELDHRCYGVSNHHVSRYFPFTLLGFWWLYRQFEVERHPDKKLVGGREFLNIEIFVVIIRFAAWILLREGGILQSESRQIITQVHAGFLIISTLCFLFSITCLKLEEPPAFSLRETLPPSPEKAPSATASPFIPPVSPVKRAIITKQPTQSTRSSPRLALKRTPPLRPVSLNTPIPPITPSYREGGTFISPSPTPRGRLGANEDEMDWDPISPTPTGYKASPWDPRNMRDRDESPTRTPLSLTSRGLNGRLNLSTPVLNQTPPSIFSAQRSPPSADPVKRQQAPMAAAKFNRIPAPSDTGLEGMFDGGLKLVDEPEILNEVERERESLGEVLGRLGILAVAGILVGVAPRGHKVLAVPAVVGVALWRLVRGDGGMGRILAGLEVLAGFTVCCAGVLGMEETTVERIGTALVVVAGVGEIWRGLGRMQRERKREFWRKERRQMTQAERRNGSQSPRAMVDEYGFRRAQSPPMNGSFGQSSFRAQSPAFGTGSFSGGGSFNAGGSFSGLKL